MASPGLGLFLAFGLPLLQAYWGQVWGQSRYLLGALGEARDSRISAGASEPPGKENSTITPTSPGSSGALDLQTWSEMLGAHLSPPLQSQGAITAIIVVFSILGALLLSVGLVLLVRKLREKRQTEGTYRPSSEEQLSHAAEARPPQDSKETVRGCLPI
nr:protein crumbs homolog 3 [Loxodonta africana]